MFICGVGSACLFERFRDLVSLMWVDDIPSFLYSFLSPPYLVRRCVIGVYEV